MYQADSISDKSDQKGVSLPVIDILLPRRPREPALF